MRMQISVSASTFEVPSAKELRDLSPARKTALLKRAKTHFDRAIAKAQKEVAALEAERAKVFSKLGVEHDAAPSREPKPQAQPEETVRPAVRARGLPARYDSSMRGLGWHERVNAGCVFPPNVAGYWRQTLKNKTPLPFPIAYTPRGYNKREFVAALRAVEGEALQEQARGYSPHRWTGKNNESREYRYKGWRWPAGYMSYLAAGVPPSRKFYLFITGKDLASLPDL